jgi:hypothetical protein
MRPFSPSPSCPRPPKALGFPSVAQRPAPPGSPQPPPRRRNPSAPCGVERGWGGFGIFGRANKADRWKIRQGRPILSGVSRLGPYSRAEPTFFSSFIFKKKEEH